MRFLFVNRHYQSEQVPTARMMRDVVRELLEQGHEVTVLTSRSEYVTGCRKEERAGVERMHLIWNLAEENKVFNWVVFLSLACLTIPFMRWDRCVILTDPPFLILAGWMSRWIQRGRKVYWWTMDMFPEALAAKKILRQDSFVYRFLAQLNESAIRSLAGVICLGPCQLGRLRGYQTWRKNEDFSLVQPPWDNRPISFVDRVHNQILKELHLENRQIAVYAGNLGEAHSYVELAQAARVAARSPSSPWLFLFAVRGAQKANLIKAIHDLPNVLVTDYFPDSMTADLLWAADVHLITLKPGWEGIVVPSKLYGILKTRAPILYVGPPGSDTAIEIRDRCRGTVLPAGASGETILAAMQELASGRAYGDDARVKSAGPAAIAAFVSKVGDGAVP